MAATAGSLRIGRAYVELFADGSKLMAGLRNAETQLRACADRMQRLGSTLFKFGAYGSLPFGLSTSMFSKFDDQMRAVQGVVGGTTEEFEKLTETAKRLGRETSFTAGDVAGGMLNLGRAGFKSDEINASIADVMNLARATQVDIPLATEIAADTLRSFGLEAKDMGRVVDVLAATANGSSQNIEDLGYALSYLAPTAFEAGMSLEDTCKAVGALANYGIKGSTAGTSLRQMLTALADADVREKLKELGVETTDKNGNLRQLADILKDLGGAIQGLPNTERLSILNDLFGQRAMASGAKLTGASFDTLYDQIDNAGGFAAQVAASMDAGIGGAFRRLLSALEGVAISIGGTLASAIQPFIENLANALNYFTEWLNQNQALVLSLAGTLAKITAIGAALIAAAASVRLFATGIGAVRGLLGALTGAAALPFKVIAASIAALFSPLGMLAAAIAAVTFAGFQAYQFFASSGGQITQLFSSVGQALANVTGTVGDWMLTKFGEVKSFFSNTINAIQSALASGNIAAAAEVGFAALNLVYIKGLNGLQAHFRNATYQIQSVWTKMVFGLASIFTTGTYSARSIWSSFTSFLRSSWVTVTTFLQNLWLKLFNKFKTICVKMYGIASGTDVSDVVDSLQKEADDAIAANNAEAAQEKNDIAAENAQTQSDLEAQKNEQLGILEENQRYAEEQANAKASAEEQKAQEEYDDARSRYDTAMDKANNPEVPAENDEGTGGTKKAPEVKETVTVNSIDEPAFSDSIGSYRNAARTPYDSLGGEGGGQGKSVEFKTSSVGMFSAFQAMGGMNVGYTAVAEKQLTQLRDIKDLIENRDPRYL